MTLLRSVVLTLFFCISATALALTPSITSISPSVLPLAGGNISVQTAGWAPSECGNICQLDVFIGDEKIPRSNLHFFGLTLTVQVPPRTTTGYERFELHHPYGAPAIVENAILFVEDEYETVLLPVGGSSRQATPGAFGSMWTTSTTVVNDTDRVLHLRVPYDSPLNSLASPPPGQEVFVPPFSTSDLRLNAPIPLVVRIPRALGDDVAFQTRVHDESRATTNFGTRVPSVRDGEFATSRIIIADVPTTDPFRATLRVYSPDRQPRSFHVRVIAQPEQLAVPGPSEPKPAPVIMELGTSTQFSDPGWAFWPYAVPFSQMQLPAVTTARVQVVIEPVDDGHAPFYAFVSVTNNETQHVTILSPR